MNIRNHSSVRERRKHIEQELSVELSAVGSSTLDETVAASKHCENMVGYTQIPVGIAGPLDIVQEDGKVQSYYIPLTTTEGALVASVSRGCKAIRENGGARVTTFRMGCSRGVVFRVESVLQGKDLCDYIYAHVSDFDGIAKQTSKHIALIDVVVKSVGRQVFVRFSYNTQDAMGMNMVTIATDAISAAISKQTNCVCISVAGNYDIDKKPAWLNAIRGRGFEVRSDIVLSAQTLEKTLKTTAKAVYDVWVSKCMIGSALAGSLGFNAQYANIIAALFLSTGQDAAHVGEGSIGITTCEITGTDSLYVSVYIPDLMVGTVGGGTGLATQTECLNLLRSASSGSNLTSEKFSTIVGAAVLAGEVSLLASLSEGSLSRAHRTLARGERI